MLHYPGLCFYQPSRALGTLDAGNVRRPAKPPELQPPRMMREPVERIAECRCNVVFVHYDPSLDKMVCSPVIAGEKESVKLFPGAVKVKDFDFQRQREFSVWGFERMEDVPHHSSRSLRAALRQSYNANMRSIGRRACSINSGGSSTFVSNACNECRTFSRVIFFIFGHNGSGAIA